VRFAVLGCARSAETRRWTLHPDAVARLNGARLTKLHTGASDFVGTGQADETSQKCSERRRVHVAEPDEHVGTGAA